MSLQKTAFKVSDFIAWQEVSEGTGSFALRNRAFMASP
jgi:hypothetical protein